MINPDDDIFQRIADEIDGQPPAGQAFQLIKVAHGTHPELAKKDGRAGRDGDGDGKLNESGSRYAQGGGPSVMKVKTELGHEVPSFNQLGTLRSEGKLSDADFGRHTANAMSDIHTRAHVAGAKAYNAAKKHDDFTPYMEHYAGSLVDSLNGIDDPVYVQHMAASSVHASEGEAWKHAEKVLGVHNRRVSAGTIGGLALGVGAGVLSSLLASKAGKTRLARDLAEAMPLMGTVGVTAGAVGGWMWGNRAANKTPMHEKPSAMYAHAGDVKKFDGPATYDDLRKADQDRAEIEGSLHYGWKGVKVGLLLKSDDDTLLAKKDGRAGRDGDGDGKLDEGRESGVKTAAKIGGEIAGGVLSVIGAVHGAKMLTRGVSHAVSRYSANKRARAAKGGFDVGRVIGRIIGPRGSWRLGKADDGELTKRKPGEFLTEDHGDGTSTTWKRRSWLGSKAVDAVTPGFVNTRHAKSSVLKFSYRYKKVKTGAKDTTGGAAAANGIAKADDAEDLQKFLPMIAGAARLAARFIPKVIGAGGKAIEAASGFKTNVQDGATRAQFKSGLVAGLANKRMRGAGAAVRASALGRGFTKAKAVANHPATQIATAAPAFAGGGGGAGRDGDGDGILNERERRRTGL